MKILASIPSTSHNDHALFIAEVTFEDIRNMTLMSSDYGKISVTTAEGLTLERQIKELAPGDVTIGAETAARNEEIAAYVNARAEIEKSMATLKGAMTKLQNLTTPKSIPS